MLKLYICNHLMINNSDPKAYTGEYFEIAANEITKNAQVFLAKDEALSYLQYKKDMRYGVYEIDIPKENLIKSEKGYEIFLASANIRALYHWLDIETPILNPLFNIEQTYSFIKNKQIFPSFFNNPPKPVITQPKTIEIEQSFICNII